MKSICNFVAKTSAPLRTVWAQCVVKVVGTFSSKRRKIEKDERRWAKLLMVSTRGCPRGRCRRSRRSTRSWGMRDVVKDAKDTGTCATVCQLSREGPRAPGGHCLCLYTRFVFVIADAASSRCCRRRPRDFRRSERVIHTSMSLRRVSPICSEV